MSTLQKSRGPLGLFLLALSACSEGAPTVEIGGGPAPETSIESRAGAAQMPGDVTVVSPTKPVKLMDHVEDFSEAVANRFVAFAVELKRRDFQKAAAWIDEDFVGHGLFGDYANLESERELGATRKTFDVDAAPVLSKTDWLAQIQGAIGPWQRVEAVVFKVKGAEFQVGLPQWGQVRFKVSFLGTSAEGGPVAATFWTWARVEKRRGEWSLHQLEVTSAVIDERDAPLFTNVSTSTGLAKSGIRFGKPGNTRFAWQGVAGGDVDGDGRWDLFLPSQTQNFLYMGQPDGSFEDEAEDYGVARPAGGTASLFLDFDNDGDQDLFVADEGWVGLGKQTQGNPLRLYVNEGEQFVERGAQLGFGGHMAAYTLTALDYDLDGFVDIFVSNYGVQNKENNNDWLDATNGAKNVLFRNLGGKGFENVAEAAGLDDGRWSYASAAADFDGDGDTDLSVVNDYGLNALLQNDGKGGFENRAEDWDVGDRGNGMGTMWGDFNSDGRLDLYVANMSSTAGNRILGRMQGKDTEEVKGLFKMAAGNSIFLAQEDGSFARQDGNLGGVGASWAWCPLTMDLDLDGHLDIYNCSGYVSGDSAEDT
ncbi:MAG: hypothetical protein ACI84E_000502 [Planctomycetota bacterium]|jgi:hypothetical protein